LLQNRSGESPVANRGRAQGEESHREREREREGKECFRYYVLAIASSL
jgi:hypothetical protein